MFYENIQGCWVCIYSFDEYTFAEKEYSNGENVGTYKIRGNKIFLDDGREYFISVRKTYIVIDEIIYLKR